MCILCNLKYNQGYSEMYSLGFHNHWLNIGTIYTSKDINKWLNLHMCVVNELYSGQYIRLMVGLRKKQLFYEL